MKVNLDADATEYDAHRHSTDNSIATTFTTLNNTTFITKQSHILPIQTE